MSNVNPVVVWAITALIALSIANPSNAQIVVSQESAPGANDFDANILGTISPFATGLTNAGYYGYIPAPGNTSFNGPAPTLTENTSHLFLVSGTDGLGLFVVHDVVDFVTGVGGGSASMQVDLVGDPSGGTVIVGDDPPEVTGGGATFTFNHSWDPCCTDGAAIGTLDGDWTAFLQFLLAPSGLTTWNAISSTGSTISLAIGAERRVRLNLVPEPSSIALIGLAGGLLMARRRRPA